MKHHCYTDWSAINNPWPWWRAWVILRNEHCVAKNSWWEKYATNNQMELQAVIELLLFYVWENSRTSSWTGFFEQPIWDTILIHDMITVFTDSSYVQQWVTQWLQTWVSRDRRRSRWWKKIANIAQWKQLHILIQHFSNLSRKRTKAHVGTHRNEYVDTQAREQAMSYQRI